MSARSRQRQEVLDNADSSRGSSNHPFPTAVEDLGTGMRYSLRSSGRSSIAVASDPYDLDETHLMEQEELPESDLEGSEEPEYRKQSGRKIRSPLSTSNKPQTKPSRTRRASMDNGAQDPTGNPSPNAEPNAKKPWLSWKTILSLVVLVALIANSQSIHALLKMYMSTQCDAWLKIPAQDLRRELNEKANFPASFDTYEFIAQFQHRLIGRPTVVHIVARHPQLGTKLMDWLHDKMPCARFEKFASNDANLIEHSGRFAQQIKSTDSNPGSCRALYIVQFKDSLIGIKNRDWIESVIDDTSPFAYTSSGQVDTSDWCIILLDAWSSDYSQQHLADFDTLTEPSMALAQRIRDVTVPLWSSRFYQRIQNIYVV